MIVLINKLDRINMIKALFLHGEQKGYGRLVKSPEISDDDVKKMLHPFSGEKSSIVIDYFKGVPIKIEISKDYNGNEYLDLSDYDYVHGEYRGLEALINTFELEEIILKRKSYSTNLKGHIKSNENQNWFEVSMMLRRMKKKEEPYLYQGKLWRFEEKKEFVPFNLRELI